MPFAPDALLDLGFEPADGARSSSVRLDRSTTRLAAARPSMGTLVNLTLLGASEDQLAEAADAAFAAMRRLVELLSRRDATSALGRLNGAGRLADAPPELDLVVRHALNWHRATEGAFDATVLPVIELFERHAEAGALPDDRDVEAARELVGSAHVTARHGSVTLARQGMALTLDGIAKGFIVDAMADVLLRRGVKRFLVEAGGDIRARGLAGSGQPWRIAVQDPDLGGAYPDVVELDGGAVATSGSYERRFDAAELHHHLVDPRTGRSPRAARSVTALAPTAMAADALATSVFLMGPDAGCRFVERLPGCACLVIDREGTQHRSRTWRSAPPAPAGKEST